MSEYLNKKAVLDDLHTEKNHLVYRRDKSDYHPEKTYCSWRIEQIDITIEKIQSGAFDVDESEGTWKATAEVLGRENAQMISEIQRLRAVLEQARRNLLANAPKTALGHIEEALSTTTVQAERINAPEGDGNEQ